MDRCEHKHKQKRYLTGQTLNIRCEKESKMIDENGRELCKHHFNKWFKKKYNKDYDTFINEPI